MWPLISFASLFAPWLIIRPVDKNCVDQSVVQRTEHYICDPIYRWDILTVACREINYC